MPAGGKQRAELLGRLAELIVAVRFIITGHRIIGWRWRNQYGEIDLIARRGGTIIFVEVKFRNRPDASMIPAPQKQERLCRTAAYFLYETHRPVTTACRFDLVLICRHPAAGESHIHHVKHAWFCAPG